METWCLPRTQIPDRLYRVQRDNSTTQDIEMGLQAADDSVFMTDNDEFAEFVQWHINNDQEIESMLISTFASLAQAKDWMSRKWRTFEDGAQVLEIDTRHLGHGYVFRAISIVNENALDTSETTTDDLHNEYLILHRVPARAIVARRAGMSTTRAEATLVQSPRASISSSSDVPSGRAIITPAPAPAESVFGSARTPSSGLSSRKDSISSIAVVSGSTSSQARTPGDRTPRSASGEDASATPMTSRRSSHAHGP
ncbi:hypothetical protein N7457_002634 [Penicillium paradoxum]|uniref:uncharacterized protein n=1 Tax=Penicillium paradoxum TaxID=176176 RepID=UPI0025465A0B|nr:uncharacterized protein N7457_002634 [Penicillium paradoxum]KAJ5787644.1 hypothetical protein N7457_002634 [Penicillium paradoxum]